MVDERVDDSPANRSRSSSVAGGRPPSVGRCRATRGARRSIASRCTAAITRSATRSPKRTRRGSTPASAPPARRSSRTASTTSAATGEPALRTKSMCQARASARSTSALSSARTHSCGSPDTEGHPSREVPSPRRGSASSVCRMTTITTDSAIADLAERLLRHMLSAEPLEGTLIGFREYDRGLADVSASRTGCLPAIGLRSARRPSPSTPPRSATRTH